MNIRVKLSREENLKHFKVPANTIVTMDIEQYIKGVVPAEVGNAPFTCCMAQAVAARTYAMPFA